MPQDDTAIVPMTPDHLDAAVALSVEAGWPHRRADWELVLGLGEGRVALDRAGQVLGTVLFLPFGRTAGAICMVIVSERLRGRGIGRRLFTAAMELAGPRVLRLTASPQGEPLYRNMGFEPQEYIFQRQGVVRAVEAIPGPELARPDDLAQIIALDAAAFGADRSALLTAIAARGRFAVIRQGDRVRSFAACRTFGRGELIGPAVVSEDADAKALLAFLARECEGRFVRLDLTPGTGLEPWLDQIGLVEVDTALVMWTEAPQLAAGGPRTVVLAAQAVG